MFGEGFTHGSPVASNHWSRRQFVIATTVKSDASGDYEVPTLKAGTYSISASAAGFADARATDIAISVGGVNVLRVVNDCVNPATRSSSRAVICESS